MAYLVRIELVHDLLVHAGFDEHGEDNRELIP